MRSEKSGASSAACAAALISGRLRSSSNGSDVSIRPENIRLRALSSEAARANTSAKITSHVFLGNISEYYAALPSGQVLRVQTHPLERFEVGVDVAVEIDAKSCSVFRRTGGSADL